MTQATRNQLVLWSIALCWVPLVAGCGRSLPPTVKVSGKVTYRGKPVPHGSVSFLPLHAAEGVPRQPATGDIQPDGAYEMKTFRCGDGVRPGEYGVTIVSYRGGKTDWAPPRTQREGPLYYPGEIHRRTDQRVDYHDSRSQSADRQGFRPGRLNRDHKSIAPGTWKTCQ